MPCLAPLLVAALFSVGPTWLTPAMAQTMPGPAATSGATPIARMEAQTKELLDINSASLEELRALPGIDEPSARKILENRPYKRKDELLDKKIIPHAVYEKIRNQIVVRRQRG